mgnify:CR=1 FL=1
MNSYLHIIFGPMFSGKSTKLINEINTLKVYKKNILIINSYHDTRIETDSIKTHNNQTYSALKLKNLNTQIIPELISKYDVIAIDEAQFFNDLYDFIYELTKYNIHIIICGLNGDRNQKKFGQIIDLTPLANKIDKLSGICTLCNDGTPGDFSILKKNKEKKKQILVGGDDIYQCVCRKHIY